MTEVTETGDDYEEETRGPSRAFPPVYVLRTATCCPECGEAMHVYTLGCAAFHDAEDSRPVEEFHFLRRTERVPDGVLALLKARCPGYYLDREEQQERPYLMNHCRCGAQLDDDYVHGDVGAAFWPDTPDGFEAFTLFRVPIDAAITVESSYMVGGGEYLDFRNAAPW